LCALSDAIAAAETRQLHENETNRMSPATAATDTDIPVTSTIVVEAVVKSALASPNAIPTRSGDGANDES
jgi:hypothetical protein